MAESPDDLELWHRRLGHLHYKYMVACKSLASGISFTIRFAERKLELLVWKESNAGNLLRKDRSKGS